MIIKNLSRRGGGSTPVLKYIFRYVFRDTTVSRRRGRLALVQELDKQTVWDRVGYARAMRSADVRFNRKDIDHLLREKADWVLTRDLLQRSYGAEHSKYVEEYLLRSRNEGQVPFVMTHNIRPFKNLEDITRQFEANEAGRTRSRKDSPTVHHTIISFSNKDTSKVTDTILKDILQEYIRLRGEDILYAIAKHEDKAHIHAHICMSATRTNGLSSRISKAEFAEIKDKLQQYQKERYTHHLEHSLPDHGKKRRELEKGTWKNIRDERSVIKNNLLDTISANETKNSQELLKELEAQGYVPYYRANVLTGVQHLESNLKFRLNRIGIDLEQLQKREERDKKEKELLEQIANIRGGNRERALFQDVKREKLSSEKDTEVLKDIENLRDERESDEDREREYDSEESDDDTDEDDMDDRDSEDEPDEEEEIEETEETEDEEDSEDID